MRKLPTPGRKRLNETSARGPLAITVKESCKRKRRGNIFQKTSVSAGLSRDRKMSYPVLFEMYLSVHFIFEGKKAEDKLIPYSCYNV